jgi:hypothetical protein
MGYLEKRTRKNNSQLDIRRPFDQIVMIADSH